MLFRSGDGIVTQLDRQHEQLRLRRRRRRRLVAPPPPPGPRFVWWQGIYSFPFYLSSLGACAWLTFGFLVFGLCCAQFGANQPTGE